MKKIYFLVLLSFCTVNLFGQFVSSPSGTCYNPSPARQVGIGTCSPSAKLDIVLGLDFLQEHESALRITTPTVTMFPPNAINENLFHIRKEGNPNTFRTQFVVKRNGNVGIGVDQFDPLLNDQRLVITDNQPNKIDLHVKGFALVDGLNGSLLLGAQTGAPYGEWGIEYNEFATTKGLNFWKPSGSNNFGNYFMFLTDRGKVSIGLDPNDPTTYNGNYKLYVADGILTERVKVAIHGTSDWSDYVFEDGYDLMPLEKVSAFIDAQGHLPNVPSAQEVVDNGIDLGQMDAKLLEKIEELTLYLIQLNEENSQLKIAVSQLQSQLK